MLSWERLDKISCSDRVRDKEVLHRDKEDRNILLYDIQKAEYP
jgi:hypothetical protein